MTTTISQQLKVFMSVATHLSVSRAARELNVTPSAVSHSLENLREVIGVILTKRTRSGIELTEAGEAVRIKAKSILLQLDSLSTMFRVPRADQLDKRLAIGASHGPSIRLVPELLARFQIQFPRLCVDVKTGTSKEIELLLRKETVEVAILSNPSNASSLTVEPIANERLLFAVATTHPLAKTPMINTTELTDLPLLVGAGQDGKIPAVDIIERSLPPKLKLNVRTTFNSPSVLTAAATRGMGVGVLYEDMVFDELSEGSLKEITVAGLNLAGYSSLVHLKDNVLSPMAAKFVEGARLYRDSATCFHNQVRSTIKRGTVPESSGRKRYSTRDPAGVLSEH